VKDKEIEILVGTDSRLLRK